MRILKLLVGAALLCVAVNCNAQGFNTQQIRPAPFTHGGFDVYQNGVQTQQIRATPFTPGSYDVYQNGLKTQQIRPIPFTPGAYDITTYGY
jgi:hypothetical protein